MGKARKVYTPGSKPSGSGVSPGRGRPKKMKKKQGTARKGNYRTTYNREDMAKAVAQVKKNKMSIREAALEFGVKKSTLHDIVKAWVYQYLFVLKLYISPHAVAVEPPEREVGSL